MSVNDDESPEIGGSGYSLDDLAEYLERDRTPAIAAIDRNPECNAVLASLERLSTLSGELIDRDADEAGAIDEGWLGGILAAITQEFRAGRDIPFPSADAVTTLSITEGAVRELVRAAGDSVPGVLIGRSSITEVADGRIAVAVTASAPIDRSLGRVADDVRTAIARTLEKHAPYAVDEVDVTIVDVHSGEGHA